MVAERKRVIQLDILRAVAILLVLFRHGPISPREAGHMEGFVRAGACLGWAGVDLFFVLSGFLIGGLLFQEIKTYGSLDVRRFLVRRAFKIWPTYFVYLVVVFFWGVYVTQEGSAAQMARSLIPNVLHVQNYFGSPRIHTWSLAVEEHFYLVLPFLLAWLMSGRKLHLVPAVALSLLVVEPALRVVTLVLHPDYDALVARYPTHLSIDGLFLGVALAHAYHYREDWWKRLAAIRGWLFVVGLILVAPMAVIQLGDGWFVRTLGHSCLAVGFACILVATLHTPITGIWRAPASVLAGVGVYSYSIYVWHQETARTPIAWMLGGGFMQSESLTLRWFAVFGLFLLLAIVPPALIARLIEMPALALRDRLFPGRSRALAQTPESELLASEGAAPAAELVSASTPS
jgi:peptidoglycan/LPS O-acetylase OafA/YrhL